MDGWESKLPTALAVLSYMEEQALGPANARTMLEIREAAQAYMPAPYEPGLFVPGDVPNVVHRISQCVTHAAMRFDGSATCYYQVYPTLTAPQLAGEIEAAKAMRNAVYGGGGDCRPCVTKGCPFAGLWQPGPDDTDSIFPAGPKCCGSCTGSRKDGRCMDLAHGQRCRQKAWLGVPLDTILNASWLAETSPAMLNEIYQTVKGTTRLDNKYGAQGMHVVLTVQRRGTACVCVFALEADEAYQGERHSPWLGDIWTVIMDGETLTVAKLRAKLAFLYCYKRLLDVAKLNIPTNYVQAWQDAREAIGATWDGGQMTSLPSFTIVVGARGRLMATIEHSEWEVFKEERPTGTLAVFTKDQLERRGAGVTTTEGLCIRCFDRDGQELDLTNHEVLAQDRFPLGLHYMSVHAPRGSDCQGAPTGSGSALPKSGPKPKAPPPILAPPGLAPESLRNEDSVAQPSVITDADQASTAGSDPWTVIGQPVEPPHATQLPTTDGATLTPSHQSKLDAIDEQLTMVVNRRNGTVDPVEQAELDRTAAELHQDREHAKQNKNFEREDPKWAHCQVCSKEWKLSDLPDGGQELLGRVVDAFGVPLNGLCCPCCGRYVVDGRLPAALGECRQMDLEWAHCQMCSREWKLPDPPNGICPCGSEVTDGRLPAATHPTDIWAGVANQPTLPFHMRDLVSAAMGKAMCAIARHEVKVYAVYKRPTKPARMVVPINHLRACLACMRRGRVPECSDEELIAWYESQCNSADTKAHHGVPRYERVVLDVATMQPRNEESRRFLQTPGMVCLAVREKSGSDRRERHLDPPFNPRGTCSGITPAWHAGDPGFDPTGNW